MYTCVCFLFHWQAKQRNDLSHIQIRNWNDVEDKFLNKFFSPSRYIKAKLTFRQGPDDPFCEAWERFNSFLRRCPNHGFEDIFCNGLRPDTKMILDAAT